MAQDKKIEDYLHLYLGCEVKHQSFVNPLVLKSVSREGIRIGAHDDGETSYSTLRENIKLILRPITDMCEQEYAFINDGYNNSNKHTTTGGIVWEAEQTRYLLSKHFDLFGLIEAGLAIDKTTLK